MAGYEWLRPPIKIAEETPEQKRKKWAKIYSAREKHASPAAFKEAELQSQAEQLIKEIDLSIIDKIPQEYSNKHRLIALLIIQLLINEDKTSVEIALELIDELETTDGVVKVVIASLLKFKVLKKVGYYKYSLIRD